MYQVFHRIEVIFHENVTQAYQFFNKGKENKIQNSINERLPTNSLVIKYSGVSLSYTCKGPKN